MRLKCKTNRKHDQGPLLVPEGEMEQPGECGTRKGQRVVDYHLQVEPVPGGYVKQRERHQVGRHRQRHLIGGRVEGVAQLGDQHGQHGAAERA